ncbi:alpha/beta fold hydrolase [Pseudalkalibacillus hwajinpoensis]|uniref:alpha/beta fold hydrolase n=1 Tax=Guptibacillus hwajinpoensis TaxID=208199 RepID=UPI00325B10EE
MREFNFELDGQWIHGVKWGAPDRQLIICLHGLTNNALGFIEMAEELEKNYHIIAFDLPGHGQTAPFAKEEDYGFTILSAWLDKVVSSISNRPFLLIGHSWGAALALHYTNHYHHKVKGIVMIDGGYVQPSDGSTTLQTHLERVTNWVTENQFNRIEEYEEKKKGEIGRWSEGIKCMVHADMIQDGNRVKMRSDEGTVRAIMKALYTEPFRDILSEIHAPVYLLRATLPEEEERIRLNATDLLRMNLKGDCRIQAVPQAGHVLHWQNPEDVILSVNGWLNGQKTTSI